MTDFDGWQSMHHAVVAGKKLAALELLKARASPTAADAAGLTPLHWAALMGHGAMVELLFDLGDEESAGVSNTRIASIVDAKGKPPLALMPIEALRYALADEATGGRQACAHELRVMGSGQADGIYVRQPILGGRTSTAQESSAATGEAGTAAAESGAGVVSGEVDEGAIVDSVADGNVVTDVVTESIPPNKPNYRRKDGAPFIIEWQHEIGWSLCQLMGPETHLCLFRSSDKDAVLVPRTGWAHTESVQITEGSLQPEMSVDDNLPWRAGASLLKATPDELRPTTLQEAVSALPEWKASPSTSTIEGNVSVMLGPEGLRLAMSSANSGENPEATEAMFQAMMEDLARRGMPPGPPPGCPTQ